MEAKDLSNHQENPCKTNQQSFSDEEKATGCLRQLGSHSREEQSSIDSDSSGKDFERMMLSQLSRERDPILPQEKEEILGCLCRIGVISPHDLQQESSGQLDLEIL